MMSATDFSQTASRASGLWPELGIWNLYFLLKFALYLSGHLNLQLLPNLVFAGFLLFPLRLTALQITRQVIAVPVGVALLYQDSWLPPFSRLLNQPGVLDFSFDYLLELAGRVINWPMLGLALVALVTYLYIHVWIRLTFITLMFFVWFGWQTPALLSVAQRTATAASNVAGNEPVAVTATEPDDMDARLQAFLERERTRDVKLRAAAQEGMADIVFLSICSMAWDDLSSSGLAGHPLFGQFDLVFDQFNSATSYSGPAVRRLMRATCGQGSHDSLHQPVPAQCSLMDQLAGQGYEVEALFNHTGEFDGFTDLTKGESSRLKMSGLLEEQRMQRAFVGFDGSPVWRDREVLSAWWQKRQADKGSTPRALLYNSITLHDGNRVALANGGSRRSDFRELAAGLLDDLAGVTQQLERTGRPLILVLIPEHGASLAGDRMQIAGMREIPSPAITHIPVAIKLVGFTRADSQEQIRVGGASSYLALAELLARLLAQEPGAPVDLQVLAQSLPETDWVSENDQTVVLKSNGQTYIRLQESGQWLPYPESR